MGKVQIKQCLVNIRHHLDDFRNQIFQKLSNQFHILRRNMALLQHNQSATLT